MSSPRSAGLVDTWGRVATDLRVSLTDRCNLRCTYCMPAEGLRLAADPRLLTDDEVVRLVRIGVERLGIREVRFTGGEPLLRRGLAGIVRRTPGARADARGLADHQRASAWRARRRRCADAGLDRVNVCLDTLRPDVFAQLTRRDRLARRARRAGGRARRPGLTPVKVNAVLMRGVNDDDGAELLRWCLERGYELRFIEQMPLDAQHDWTRSAMVTAEEILASARARVHPEPRPRAPRAARRPSCSWSTAARRRSASSPR